MQRQLVPDESLGKGMSIQRIFLGWNRPALESAVRYLEKHYLIDKSFDLSSLIVVVPGSRAGRRLVELLVDVAERTGASLFPPEIVTQGRLPEKLYQAQKPFADDLTQQLAWVQAIRGIDIDEIGCVFARLPADKDLMGWLALGNLLSRLHRELTAEGLNFKAVRKCGSKMDGFVEGDRWKALERIQRAYLDILNGLGLWDMQTARLFAIDHEECLTSSEILLLGTADMNQALRRMLDPLEKQVKALVIAPESMASRFDEYGCILPEAWQDADPGFSMDQVRIANDPSAQAQAMAADLAALDGRYSAQEIALGVPDESLVPLLASVLEPHAIDVRFGKGTPAGRTEIFRILQQMAEFLENHRYAAFATLVRFPKVQDWLERRGIKGDWLTEIDGYHELHLPDRVREKWKGEKKAIQRIAKVQQELESLLEPMQGKARPLGAWCDPLAEVLIQLTGNRRLDSFKEEDRELLHIMDLFREVFQQFKTMQREVEPRLKGSEAVQLALGRIQGEFIPPPQQPHAIEMLGWLELPMDDTPVLILTGFNEGTIPSSLNADLFLPNHLRRELKIEDNDRRFARDAYALSTLVASRKEMRICCSRRSAEGDPLSPSRLLFAGDEVEVAKRAIAFFGDDGDGAAAFSSLASSGGKRKTSDLAPSRPAPLPEPVTSMRITEFADYVRCPYRYYLKHRLRLERSGDRAEEISASEFGSLAHTVLKQFGEDRLSTSTDAKKIAARLDSLLDACAARIYGSDSLAVVRVQIEQLRKRLHAFAEWQAGHAADGWRIEHVEVSPDPGKAGLDVDGSMMGLRGRIDRIDVNVNTGERIIYDYKTSESTKSPEKNHCDSEGWIDFQLPLYRHLANALGLEGPFKLGYIVLPKDLGQVKDLIAKWDEGDLEEADRSAADVVRCIRKEMFWPPDDAYDFPWDDFAALCMSHDPFDNDKSKKPGARAPSKKAKRKGGAK